MTSLHSSKGVKVKNQTGTYLKSIQMKTFEPNKRMWSICFCLQHINKVSFPVRQVNSTNKQVVPQESDWLSQRGLWFLHQDPWNAARRLKGSPSFTGQERTEEEGWGWTSSGASWAGPAEACGPGRTRPPKLTTPGETQSAYSTICWAHEQVVEHPLLH